MSNVASDYPARREVDGRGERVWFRPAIRDASETWGWTCDPAQAHPDYQVKVDQFGVLVTWVGDRPKLCVVCAYQPPEFGDLCADHRDYRLPDDCRASCESNCPAGRCLWAETHQSIPATTTTKGTDMPTKSAGVAAEKAEVDAAFDAAGSGADEPRFTEWSHYPLPPKPPRFKVIYDGYGRYKLPSPTTGRPTGFSRATTIAKTLEETYNLSRWSRRQAVKAIIAAVQSKDDWADRTGSGVGFDVAGDDRTPVGVLGDVVNAIEAEDDRALDKAVDLLDNITGGADARELGEAVHAWLEAVDTQTVLPAQVPEQFQPYVVAYRAVLAKHGLVAVAVYVERIVLNDQGEETVVGTIDRIYRVVTTGALVLGDVKTSKTLEYGWLPYAVQFAVYGYATKMFRADGDASQGQHGWEPMPNLDLSACYCLHVPSNQPERAACVTFDLYWGGETMIASIDARRRRKEAAKKVASVHEIPVPSKAALRYVAARDTVLDITSAEDLPGVWESYQDVWTDDLTELGNTVAQLIDAAA